MEDSLELIGAFKCFNGYQKIYKHKSEVLNCEMHFGIYLPEAVHTGKQPALFYLSGLTCTHANFIEKSGVQRLASSYGYIVVNPDTSPRGDDVANGDSWDIGKGAGFYVDATEKPWSDHYKMYSYVTKELVDLVFKNFPIDTSKVGIFGHSMGGHGAISIGLKNPHIFKSISAFSAVCHPMKCAWGKKVFSNYLGADEATWEQYDSSLLAKKYNGPKRIILLDIGEADQFLKDGSLQPESLVSNEHLEILYKGRPEYGHTYYFVATFLESHFDHHTAELKVNV